MDVDDEESEKAPVLTLDEVKKWSKALLEVCPFSFSVRLFVEKLMSAVCCCGLFSIGR